MRTRKLSLVKDTLHELRPDDLARVVGADITHLVPTYYECPLSGMYPTIPVRYCRIDG